MLLSSVSASREVPALDSARSVASPPLSKRGVLGKDGVEMALKEWSGKYHRRQVEISEIAAHVEMLKKQRDTLQNEVKQQEKDITSLEAELAQQRDEQLPALKLRYENASRLKHKLNRAVAEQRAASRELQIRRASLTRDIERKRSEVSSARSRKESISRKVRELDERRKLAEKQKAHRERQLGKGLDKLRKSQTDILLAEREILTLKEGIPYLSQLCRYNRESSGINVSVRSIRGGGLSLSSRGASSAAASHARLGTMSSYRSDDSPVSNALSYTESDTVQAPRSARLKRPPPGIMSLINASAPAPANTPVEVIDKPLEAVLRGAANTLAEARSRSLALSKSVPSGQGGHGTVDKNPSCSPCSVIRSPWLIWDRYRKIPYRYPPDSTSVMPPPARLSLKFHAQRQPWHQRNPISQALNCSQQVKGSALFSGNDEEEREPLGKDAESGARAVLAKSGGIPHAKETASGESPVTSRMATGVLKSSAGSVGHSTTTSAVLKRVVGAESSSEDEGETTHAATKGIHGRSAKPKPAGLEKLLGSVASSKPVDIRGMFRLSTRRCFLHTRPVVQPRVNLPSTSELQAIQTSLATKGYATLEQLLCPQQALTLADKFPAIFRGEFDTGVFPDEWHWREGISKESAPREIVNAWKADDTVAGVVLSRELGSLVKAITGWESVRVAQDDLWWKAPATANSATKGHTDAEYFNFFKDNSLLTLWIALDPVGEENSPLQYIEGSHQWPVRKDNEATFHRGSEEAGSILTGGDDVFATCPHQYAGLVRDVSVLRGGCSFHLGNTWHGSPPNKDTKMHRRSLAIHYIPGNNAFDLNVKTGYIYGKYRMSDDDSTLHDCFFPIVG
ncbi:hypothetical protein FOZ60_015890 [Perkinsus olseni]|uniref:Phytanoyl-CoA dioxygenase n=1 Tax=Perkinsus olseni TaxID=32597 RepID=A0A7J6N527_PEROL|nr:hypothetical protein FOZ60_015890 [Perkinsus olseni]